MPPCHLRCAPTPANRVPPTTHAPAGEASPPDACDEISRDATHRWHLIPRDLARGCIVACSIQHHLRASLRIDVSVGVSRTRLLSRLLSPLNKPRGISVLPPSHVPPFMAAIPLSAIPSLGGKAGARLTALGAATVGDLQRIPPAALASAADPALLAGLWRGGPEDDLKDTGPRQSIAVERSFQATELPSQMRAATAPLVDTLCRRVVRRTLTPRRAPRSCACHSSHRLRALATIPYNRRTKAAR